MKHAFLLLPVAICRQTAQNTGRQTYCVRMLCCTYKGGSLQLIEFRHGVPPLHYAKIFIKYLLPFLLTRNDRMAILTFFAGGIVTIKFCKALL